MVEDIKTTYSPMDSDLPTVQVPVGRSKHGLSIDGTFYPYYELPEGAKRAYRDWMDGGKGIGGTDVYMCNECDERDDGYQIGYLTTSDNIGCRNRNPYTCNAKYKEEVARGANRVGRFAPETWSISISINGDDSIQISQDKGRDYELCIEKKDGYGYNADTVDKTILELPDTERVIKSETAGCQWMFDINYPDDNSTGLIISCRRVDASGCVRRYKYRETEGMQHKNPNEICGFTEKTESSDDNVYIRELECTIKTIIKEQTCESENFTKVWPKTKYMDSGQAIPIDNIDESCVPNSKSHLGRIQSQVQQSISTHDMLLSVAKSVKRARESSVRKSI